MTSDSSGTRRVAQLRNDVDDVYDILTIIRQTQTEHSARLGSLERTQAEHTKRFDGLDARFDEVLELLRSR